MKTPATHLNNFIQKLAVFLKKNQPDFVERYNVTFTHVPRKGTDHSQIRMVTLFEISNKKVRDLEGANLITDNKI